MTIKINLTGDFALPDGSPNVEDHHLHELDAFLGALRGTVAADKDTFLGAIAGFVRQVKAPHRKQIVLEIDSTVSSNKLTHTFRLTSEPQ